MPFYMQRKLVRADKPQPPIPAEVWVTIQGVRTTVTVHHVSRETMHGGPAKHTRDGDRLKRKRSRKLRKLRGWR